MNEQNAIYKLDNDDPQMIETVLLHGDLSKLTPGQRVNYYQRVCQSMGLNPLTQPFGYITLNGKLTLYAKKDATDQLRAIHNISIDDVDMQETATHFIVKVKGHDSNGRTDIELGVVIKTDMGGNIANLQMKVVTKGKRRLTLSLCGLGWLDETEIETIPKSKTVNIKDNGELEPMTYEESASIIIMDKNIEKRLDSLSAQQLQYVIENNPHFEKIEAAKIVLAHDYQETKSEESL